MKNANAVPAVFWTATVLLFVLGVVLPESLSFLRDDYSSAANYISELGAVGADYGFIANWGSYLPVTVLSAIAITCLMTRFTGQRLVTLGLALWIVGLSLGYFTAFLFPCDAGCPIDGSDQQMMHNLSGAVVYPLGIIGMFCLAVGFWRSGMKGAALATLCVGVIAIIGFVMMVQPDQAAVRGLWQRAPDYAMFLLIGYLGRYLRAA